MERGANYIHLTLFKKKKKTDLEINEKLMKKQKQPYIGIHLQSTKENKRSQSSEYKHIQNYSQAV